MLYYMLYTIYKGRTEENGQIAIADAYIVMISTFSKQHFIMIKGEQDR